MYTTEAAVNAFLLGKFNIDEIDAELESAAVSVVFAKLGALYETSGWTDEATTPELVQSIIGMLYAAWKYQAVAGQDAVDENYGTRLEARAMLLLDGILTNALDIGVEPNGVDTSNMSVMFWPTDASTLGGDSPRAFEMGMRF